MIGRPLLEPGTGVPGLSVRWVKTAPSLTANPSPIPKQKHLSATGHLPLRFENQSVW